MKPAGYGIGGGLFVQLVTPTPVPPSPSRALSAEGSEGAAELAFNK